MPARSRGARPPLPGRVGWRGVLILLTTILGLGLTLGLGTGPAMAQVKRPPRDLPVALTADKISVDAKTGDVIAEGSVEVYHGKRTLTADRIHYNNRTGRITASGKIVLRDETGATVYADAAELDSELVNGLVKGARATLGRNARLAAVEARRVDKRYNTLSKAVYSPCKVCKDDPTPMWRIRARRVIHDEKERVIHYENATFDVFGVPVAWLPYFSHPDPSVARASGFLVPRFQSSSIYGYGVKVPYYWVIDEHSDATITPFITSDDGIIIEGEYRRAFRTGRIKLGGSLTVNDYLGNQRLHGHLDTEGLFAIGSGIEWGWDVTISSDDGYLRRFEISNDDRLTSEVFVRRYRRSGYFELAGVYFQSLRDGEPAGSIPKVLPAVDMRYNFDDRLMGGRMHAMLTSYTLLRNNGRDVGRTSLGFGWDKDFVTDWGLAMKTFAEARADLFLVSDDPTIRDDATTRFTALAGVELRFPLVSDRIAGATHVIEPVVQAIVAPYGGNSGKTPVEDSLVTEFDETNVIERNHFAGLDSVEEGPRINVLVRYERIVEKGIRFDASVGRVFRFKSQKAFSSGSGLSSADSDYVAAWMARLDPFLTLRHRMRFSNDATLTRNEMFGDFKYSWLHLKAGLVFFEADPDIGADTDREELNAEARIRFDRNWSISGFGQRDLQAGEFVAFGGGVSYLNECCAIDLFVKRRATSSTDAPASTTFGVQVRLLTLGEGDEK